MRIVRITAIPAVLLGLCASVVHTPKLSAAPDEGASDHAAITKILEAQQNNWNRGNVDAFLEGYWHSPDLTFSGSSGITRGWDGVLARYKKNYPDRATMGQLEFSGLEFRFPGKDAALFGVATFSGRLAHNSRSHQRGREDQVRDSRC